MITTNLVMIQKLKILELDVKKKFLKDLGLGSIGMNKLMVQ
jgi:hypothetical protein